jgi:hypothetical protein
LRRRSDLRRGGVQRQLRRTGQLRRAQRLRLVVRLRPRLLRPAELRGGDLPVRLRGRPRLQLRAGRVRAVRGTTEPVRPALATAVEATRSRGWPGAPSPSRRSTR